jgi:hypothetical protein
MGGFGPLCDFGAHDDLFPFGFPSDENLSCARIGDNEQAGFIGRVRDRRRADEIVTVEFARARALDDADRLVEIAADQLHAQIVLYSISD